MSRDWTVVDKSSFEHTSSKGNNKKLSLVYESKNSILVLIWATVLKIKEKNVVTVKPNESKI